MPDAFLIAAAGLLIALVVILLFSAVPTLLHECDHEEKIGGLYADIPGGPVTFHEIWWECSCGGVIDPEAKARADMVDRPLGVAA